MFKEERQYHSTLALPPKQLRMVLDEVSVVRLPDVPLPAGYVMRAYRSGDADSWTEVLQKGEFGRWDEERVLEYLEDAERREGSRLVEHNGRIVAATFASRIGNQPRKPSVGGGNSSDVGVLDYVVTHPDHRGRGLGRATCTEVARFLVSRGCNAISLGTDDWRLPAIHIYLSMGFRPVMNRNDMPGRWAAVYENLKETGRDHV